MKYVGENANAIKIALFISIEGEKLEPKIAAFEDINESK